MKGPIYFTSLSTHQRYGQSPGKPTPLQPRPRRLCTVAFSTLLSSVILSLGLIPHANASDINGIFSPRGSESFFQQGLERLEDNIEQLGTRYERERLEKDGLLPLVEPLRLDDSIEQQRQEIEDNGTASYSGSHQHSLKYK
ncbi:MAG: hypothetical protein AAGD25_17505 [Cyanobacteria bacterium P01_F01_bin.150]